MTGNLVFEQSLLEQFSGTNLVQRTKVPLYVELADVTAEDGKFEVGGAGPQTRDSGRS